MSGSDYKGAFTRNLVRSGYFRSRPFAVVDVGARGGFESFWPAFYGDQVRLIGFEPDEADCEQLNRDLDGTKHVYASAIHKDKEERLLYRTLHPSSCSLYEPNRQVYERFVDHVSLKVIGTTHVVTEDLDSFVQTNEIEWVDYMKLDAEGAELDVLKGAESLLDDSVIALNVEVAFLEANKGRPLFSEIELFLRERGFTLFSLEPYRCLRRALPERLAPVPVSKVGQTVCGDALFLRDGAAELQGWQPQSRNWDKLSIVKLASMMEIFRLRDCSVELLQIAREKGLLAAQEAEHYIDLLTPEIDGINSYKDYFWYLKIKELPYFLQSVAATRPDLGPAVAQVSRYLKEGDIPLAMSTINKEFEYLKHPLNETPSKLNEWQKYFYGLLFESNTDRSLEAEHLRNLNVNLLETLVGK
ncbi:MAG: FkbM family methyltransferase [Planctomycetota bacterium]|jgi:FkbM family methyltransferase